MKIIVEHKEFFIEWEHFHPFSSIHREMSITEGSNSKYGTICKIFQADKNNKEIINIITIGKSFLHPNDKNFNRKIGRKISLKNALLNHYGNEENLNLFFRDKLGRGQIWKQLREKGVI